MAKPRTPPGRDLIWRLEALGFDLFTLFVRALGPDLASSLGAAIGKAIGPLTGAHRTAARNLALAFPEMDEAERAGVLAAQWDNFGRYIFEFPQADRLTPASGRVSVVGGERLAAVAASGRPAVLISGHFANIEIMAAVILEAGLDCDVTYRAANNPYVDARIIESRRRYGVRLFAPKGAEGARDLLAALKAGRSVALLNDQRYDGGVATPFFGHEVRTLPAAARLALRFGTIIQPMAVRRTGGARFEVTIHEPIRVAARRGGEAPALRVWRGRLRPGRRGSRHGT